MVGAHFYILNFTRPTSTSYTINVYGKYSATTAGRYVWYSINDSTFASPTRLTNTIGATTGALGGTISAVSAQTVYIAVSDAVNGPTIGVDPFFFNVGSTYPASFPTACNTGVSSVNINTTPVSVYLSVLSNGLACSVGTNELGTPLA